MNTTPPPTADPNALARSAFHRAWAETIAAKADTCSRMPVKSLAYEVAWTAFLAAWKLRQTNDDR